MNTCYCPAFKFPHRHGSGACTGPGEGDLFCAACGEPCRELTTAIPRNLRYTPGATNHPDWPDSQGSNCCGASVIRMTVIGNNVVMEN